MSLDDFLNRTPQVPPVVDFDQWQSSLDVDYPPLDPGRQHLISAVAKDRGFNTTINRFDPTYWTAVADELSVAAIKVQGARSFDVVAQYRSNAAEVLVRWLSKDTLSHQNFSYQENPNYQNTVVAFKHNCPTPDKFTALISNTVGTFTYRLAPYGWNSVTKKYECLDTKYGTDKTYPESVYVVGDAAIADEDMIPYKGRVDYIFILDFNDLRMGHNYSAGLIDPRNISAISLDFMTSQNGLGDSAYLVRALKNSDGTVQLELGGAHTTAQLSAGDTLQAMWTYASATDAQFTRWSEWTVVSSTGFGTSALSVKATGPMLGSFIKSDVLYARRLLAPAPVTAIDLIKSVVNITVTGTAALTVGKRSYPQDLHDLKVVTDLDQLITSTPERQVAMVKGLGYHTDWMTGLGQTYFNARTAYQKKSDASLVLSTEVLDWPVLYAGEAQLNGQYVVGKAPGRGIDALYDHTSTPWGVNVGGIYPVNGTTLNSAVDRASATLLGSYWWDIENNQPGPALLNAVAAMNGRSAHGIVWCQGDTDALSLADETVRSPMPTIARMKTATEAVFAYFRSLWGANLPIWIQEQAWGWAATDPLDPSNPGTGGPIQKGAPTYLRVRRNAWGDLVFEWKSYDLDPALANYRVEVYNPIKIGTVLHTFTVSGTQQDGDYVYADWPVENNAPVRAQVDSGNDIWGGIRWRVVSISAMGEFPSQIKSGLVPLDQTIVRKQIVLGPNLYSGGYFTKLSDSTGVGRRDLVAATEMRGEYARKAGLRLIQVIPLDVSDEDRGDEDTDFEDMRFGLILRDWWHNGAPAESLLKATVKVQQSALPVAHFMEGSPGEIEMLRTQEPGTWLDTLNAIRQANIDMLAWMRTNWGNPNLEFWLQGSTSIWMGTDSPININVDSTEAARKSQSILALDRPDFLVGSYVPGGDQFANFNLVGLERKYPNVDMWHATAREMGESMALHIDRAYDDSDCPSMVIEVTPSWSTWGGGWYSLYAAPKNGKWGQTGTVDIANNRLAYVLLSLTGDPIYGSQTEVGVWGYADEPVIAISLLRNQVGIPLNMTPKFVEVASPPYEFDGMWVATVPGPAFIMDSDDTLRVTLPGTCFHDTGDGCDTPITIIMEGEPFEVTPTLYTLGSEWRVQYGSLGNNLIPPTGAIDIQDFIGMLSVSPGVFGVTVANTTLIRWGHFEDGFSSVDMTYKGVTKNFPLMFNEQAGGPTPGVWQYSVGVAQFDMHEGLGISLVFRGGKANAHEVVVCGSPQPFYRASLRMAGTDQGASANKEARVGADVMPWYSGMDFVDNYSGPRVMHSADNQGQYFYLIARDAGGNILPEEEQPIDWAAEVLSGPEATCSVYSAELLAGAGLPAVLLPTYVPGASLLVVLAAVGDASRIRYYSPSLGCEGFIRVQQVQNNVRLMPRAQQPAFTTASTLDTGGGGSSCASGNNNLYQTTDINDLSFPVEGFPGSSPHWPQSSNQLWYDTPPASQLVMNQAPGGTASYSYDLSFVPTDGGPWINIGFQGETYWTETLAQYLGTVLPADGVKVGEMFFGPDGGPGTSPTLPSPGKNVNILIKNQQEEARATEMFMALGGTGDDGAMTFSKKSYESIWMAPIITEEVVGKKHSDPDAGAPAFYAGNRINDFTIGGSCTIEIWGTVHNNVLNSPYVLIERQVEPPIMD